MSERSFAKKPGYTQIEAPQRQSMSNERRLFIIGLNGLLVGGIICLIAKYGLSKTFVDFLIVTILPFVFIFTLCYTASSQKVALNRAILSCLFVIVGMILAIISLSTTTSELPSGFFRLSFFVPFTLIFLILSISVGWLAFWIKDKLPTV